MTEQPRRRPRPLVVVDDATVYLDVLAEVAGAGWTIVPVRTVIAADECAEYALSSEGDVRGAVIAAATGAALLVRVLAPSLQSVDSAWHRLIDELVDDLASLGPTLRPHRGSTITLERLTWQVAHDLARGLTLDAAAARAHLSRRTAHRRVTDARAALGADSRAQLIRALHAPDRVPPAAIAR